MPEGARNIADARPTSDEFKLREDLQRAQRLLTDTQRELERLKESCPHLLHEDTAGYEYDGRSCWVCGKGLGIL